MTSVSAEGPVRKPNMLGGAAAALVVGATAWIAASVVALTYGMELNWPDYLHVNFGFPLVFATHTLNTIAGPVDLWDVNLGALTMDLLFWLGGMAVVFLSGLWWHGRRNRGGAALAFPGPLGASSAQEMEGE